jgi:polysaccharide biosynthesis protein PslG
MRSTLPKLLFSVLAAAVVAVGAGSSPAQAKVAVGIGQQTPELFSSPYWLALKSPYVRYITPYDTVTDPGQLSRLDPWMFGARVTGAHVVIGFRSSLKSARLTRRLPTQAQYTKAFRAFRARYPWVRDYIPWNETNHPTSLTGPRPYRAAQYFNVVRRYCRTCNVAAGDVLDIRNMESWIGRYKRSLKYTPKIWSIHNYHDANARTSQGVRRLMRVTKGQIWMTETGGVVKMRAFEGKKVISRNYGTKKAAAATKYVLNLAKINRRITRIYLYHWRAPKPYSGWDSALMDARLRPRPAYRTLKAWLVKARRTGLAR